MSHIPPLFRTIKVTDLTYPHEMKTNADLVDFAALMLFPKATKSLHDFMVWDVLVCLLTALGCIFVFVRKGRMRELRFFTLRRSSYGTFIVPSSVWIFLSGIFAYLLVWAGYVIYLMFCSTKGFSISKFSWFFNSGHLPLSAGGFYSAYGYVMTCSPRSPISNLRSGKGNTGKSVELDLPANPTLGLGHEHLHDWDGSGARHVLSRNHNPCR